MVVKEEKAKRHFTVAGSDIGFTGGSYDSSSPRGAGSKAATKMFQAIENGVLYASDKKKNAKYAKFAEFAKYKNTKSIKFILRETTQDSKKKSFYYEVTQTKFKEPKIINRGGVDVQITKAVTIKACKEPIKA